MSSVIQAANRKIRKRPDKPKTSDSVDIDFESEPSQYNERNIDREIEIRKGRELSGNSLLKESVCLSLEQASASSAACSMSVHDSKSSLSLDQGQAAREMMSQSSSDLKASMSSLGALSSARSGTSLHQPPDREQWSPPFNGGKQPPVRRDDLPIKRYPAYPRVDLGASPQTETTKPTLLKKYSSEELNRGEWRQEEEVAAAADGGHPEWTRDHDEVKKTYGLTQQTKQHLRRIKQETEALRQREQEQRKHQQRTALAKQRVELELQKTRLEMEEDHSIDDLLMAGEQQSSLPDNQSITSDYSTMSSTNLQGKLLAEGQSMDYSPVRCSSSVPRELHYSSPGSHDKAERRSPPSDATAVANLTLEQQHSSSRLPSRPDHVSKDVSKDDSRLKTSHRAAHSRHVVKPSGRMPTDDVHKIRKGSLDSLLDICHHDLSHIDSDEEDRGEEGLLESIASADPQFKTLLSAGSNRKATLTSTKHKDSASANNASGKFKPDSSKSKSERTSAFRDPTLHKGSGDVKVVGIASRFERREPAEPKHLDRALPCYKPATRPTGVAPAGSNSGKLSSASRHSKENQPPVVTRESGQSSKSRSDQRILTSQRAAGSQPNRIHRQDSGNQTSEQYASSLRKSTEKLFGSCENLIDLRSPDEQVPPPGVIEVSKSKSASPEVNAVLKATDRKSKRRRHTVGGTDDLEHMKALLTATHQYLNHGDDPPRSAWDRLQPRSPVTDDVRDVKSWCMHQRLRHVGSSPALYDPQLVAAVSADEPPMKRKGSVKSSEGKQPSRSGSNRSQKSSSHSSSASPSSPAPRTGGPNAFNFVHPI